MPVSWDDLRRQERDRAVRKRIGLPDPLDEKIEAHADEREKVHANSPTSRPLSDGYEKVGLAGERTFCAWAGIGIDLIVRPRGTQSVNYTVEGKKINVFTARKPKHLLVEKGKAKADIYVLCRYRDEDNKAIMLGWASKAEVLAAPVLDTGGFGILSHSLPRGQLHPMDSLKPVLGLSRQTTMFPE